MKGLMGEPTLEEQIEAVERSIDHWSTKAEQGRRLAYARSCVLTLSQAEVQVARARALRAVLRRLEAERKLRKERDELRAERDELHVELQLATDDDGDESTPQ